MTASATATKTTTPRARRTPLVGEVNITNDAAARAAIETLRVQKRAERAGGKAKRERTAEGGSEAVIRALLTSPESVLVIAGQPVAKLSSERHIPVPDLKKLAEMFPEAYAACVTDVTYRNVEVTGV